MPDQQIFLNQDLVLRVSPSIDPARFEINRYEPLSLTGLYFTRHGRPMLPGRAGRSLPGVVGRCLPAIAARCLPEEVAS